MKLTAVILHYWVERTQNIKEIVKGLQKGSCQPDKIIIFNNNADVQYPSTSGVSVINSDHNYGGRVRYPIALLEPSDYYFFIDDDVAPRANTLKNFMRHTKKNCCLGYVGKAFHTKARQGEKYSSATVFWGNKIAEVTGVDLLVGRGTIFVSFATLLKMFKREEKLLKEGFVFGREEDIVLSMGNKPKVIPAKPDEFLVDLPEGGVGYWRVPGHIDLRNQMVAKLMEKK